MRGIILAGGAGTRLHPATLATSKQLLPVYDKPMIYYPLGTLMLSGIRETLIVVAPDQIDGFKRLLGDGSQWGLNIEYATQDQPRGLPDAYILGAEFVRGEPSALILGDNLFYGAGVGESLSHARSGFDGAKIFCQPVKDPERFGVVVLDESGNPLSIVEKPVRPASDLAITGFYFFDGEASRYARELKPSSRNELEIVDLLKRYLDQGQLQVQQLERGTVWLDTGTFESLAGASEFVRVVQQNQNFRIGCPEEIAWRMGFISDSALVSLGQELRKSSYGEYLMSLVG